MKKGIRITWRVILGIVMIPVVLVTLGVFLLPPLWAVIGGLLLLGPCERILDTPQVGTHRADKQDTVAVDLTRYLENVKRAGETCRYVERIDKIYVAPEISESDIIGVYNGLLVEMRKIHPKTPEIRQVHADYVKMLEDYVSAIKTEGHASALVRYRPEHMKVMRRLSALCKDHSVKVKIWGLDHKD